MRFTVIDKKTGKEADTYEIALHEEWANNLIYCDIEGWFIGEDGELILADECGNFTYADRDRFMVEFDDRNDEERPQGEWKPFNSYYRKCDKCERMVGFDYADPEHGNWFNYCPNCGAQMIGGIKK